MKMWNCGVNVGVVHISLLPLSHHNRNVAYICLYCCVYMQIFFPVFHNGYCFVVCFNFLAKKVEIIHSVSHNNVDNCDILDCVSLLVIFYVTFSSFCHCNPLTCEVTYCTCILLFFHRFGVSQSIFPIKSPNQPGVNLFLLRVCNWSNLNYLGWKFRRNLIPTQGCM